MKDPRKPMQQASLNDEPEHRITYEGPLIRTGMAERLEATQNNVLPLKNSIIHNSSINSKNMQSNQSEKESRSNRQPFQKSQNSSIKNFKN